MTRTEEYIYTLKLKTKADLLNLNMSETDYFTRTQLFGASKDQTWKLKTLKIMSLALQLA